MNARRNPPRYYPLAADPEFRYALRGWETYAATPAVKRKLTQGGDAAARRLAEKELARAVLRVFLAAVGWSVRTEYGDAEEEIGSAMTPVILSVAHVLNIPNAPAPVVQSIEKTVAPRGPGAQTATGRRLSEGVPPCWSPRWATERDRLRKYTTAQLFAGEMLSYLLRILPFAIDLMKARLQTARHEQGGEDSVDMLRLAEPVIGFFMADPVEARHALSR